MTKMRRPGIEPGSTAWKAAMLTTIPPTLVIIEIIYLIKIPQFHVFADFRISHIFSIDHGLNI